MLKRLIYRLVVGLMTFVIGLSLTFWNLLFIKPETAVLQSDVNLMSDSSLDSVITLCMLDAHPQLYLGKQVRLRDLMFASDWQTLEDILITDFSGKEKAKLIVKLGKNEESTDFSLGENPCTSDLTDVEVTGYLEPKVEKDNPHHYQISDARIVKVRREYCY